MPVTSFRPHPSTPKANRRATCRTIPEIPALLGDDLVMRMPEYICKGAGSRSRLRRRSMRPAKAQYCRATTSTMGSLTQGSPEVRHRASCDDVIRGIDNVVEGEAGFWQFGCGRSSLMTVPSGLWRTRVLRTHGPTAPDR